VRQLSGMDAAFLYTERPHAPNHITTVLVYDPDTAPDRTVTFDRIIANIESRLHLAAAFKEKILRVPLGLDHPYWTTDPEFDLEFHVRHTAIPRPGTWEQFCEHAAAIHARALDPTRPLWEMHVVEGLDAIAGLPAGCFGIVLKIHHSAIDGVAGAQILTAIHDLVPDPGPSAPPPDSSVDDVVSLWQLLLRAGANAVVRPVRVARIAARITPPLRLVPMQIRRKEVRVPSVKVPLTRFNAKVTAHRVFESRSFDLAEVKLAKTAVPGATVNDVALAVVGAAMRKYLAGKDELPKESLVALVPVSVRPDRPSGERPGRTGTATSKAPAGRQPSGNHITAMSAPLGTHLEDPIARLAYVTQATRQAKAFMHAISAHELTEIAQVIPGLLIGLGARAVGRVANPARTGLLANTVVTNVPGAPSPLYSCGARAVLVTGMGPVVDGLGTMHVVSSYCGSFVVALSACREMVPDPAEYGRCIDESIGELLLAARGPRTEPAPD
jgi:diacylglycerol O-acyltransferase